MNVAVKKCKKEIPHEAASPAPQPLNGTGLTLVRSGMRSASDWSCCPSLPFELLKVLFNLEGGNEAQGVRKCLWGTA